MIRPFSLRDLALVRRLRKHSTCLDTESALTGHEHLLRGALFGLIGGNRPTLVWRAEQRAAAGFAQLHVVNDLSARIVHIAVTSQENGSIGPQAIDEDNWLALLDDVTVAIGRRGIHSLTAEVDESGPELIVLRRAGFAVYTRQDVWVMHERPVIASSAYLQERRPADDWDIEWLYANTVPPLIQLVEPSPPKKGDLWVLREEGELTAFSHISRGARATWLQIFVHPNAYAQAEDIVNAAVQLCPENPEHPVYCCVRRYQSWLQSALECSGFTRHDSQAVMVKHISKPVAKKVGALERLLSNHGVRPTTLLQRYETSPDDESKPASEEWILR